MSKHKTKKGKIAAYGFWPMYNKRFEFIGAIEDLVGFYKKLLYSEQGQDKTHILIGKVKQMLNWENEKIRDVILLLFYYLEYEKCYLENERKVKGGMKEKDKLKEIRKKTRNNLKKTQIYNYSDIKVWAKNINQDSVEYQLADSILKHVYKEPEIDKEGKVNPEKLRNYKFEYYFDFIKKV